MHISVKGEYALHALFDLSMQRTREPVKIAGIAKRQKIPQKFLELILAGLKQGGFVESRRGAEGGYLLARPPEAITVGEVLRFIEGSGKNNTPKPGANNDDDPFADMWRRVDGCIGNIVDRTTFSELCRAWQENQARYIPNWEI